MIPAGNFLAGSASFIILITILLTPSPVDSLGSLIYCGCSQLKYGSNPRYESNVNSLLTSLVNSAGTSYYNKFSIGAGTGNVVHGIFECRPDIQLLDCASCVANSVSQLGSRCGDSAGGVVQLDGCYVKYDNRTFIGVEDTTVVEKNCGPPAAASGYNSAELTMVDSVLGYLESGGGLYRVGGSGDVQGVAQCRGDLSGGQCQDCLTAAIGQLRGGCSGAAWGDAFLGTCYVRYFLADGGGTGTYSPPNNESSQNHNDLDEDLAILFGLVAVVILIVFLTAYGKRSWEKKAEVEGK